MKTGGLDVHKDNVFCAIYDGKAFGEVKTFSTLTSTLKQLGKYLKKEGVKQVAMESTASYWVPVWNILEEMGLECILVNPYQIKQMPGRKSDTKDAQWIAELLHKGLLRPSLIPEEKIREWRVYTRNYVKIQQSKNKILNEMDRTLVQCNIRISNYVANFSAKSIYDVIKAIIAGETDPALLAKNIHNRIRNKYGELISKSLEGCIKEHFRFSLECLMEKYDLLLDQEEKVLERMQKIGNDHFKAKIERLCSLPGINILAAIIILAECGADMKAFDNSGKLVGWTGLRPRNDVSNGKFKATAITKGNKYIRAILMQVVWTAVRMKGSCFSEKYCRLIVRKPKKKAIIAIARKFTVIIWHVLAEDKPFDPDRAPAYDPLKVKEKLAYYEKQLEQFKKLAEL
jgi:transposase